MSNESGEPAESRRPEVVFDSDDPEFIRGFELGNFWAYLREYPDQAVDGYLHGSNAEMALRLAASTNREVQSQELDDNWVLVKFSPQGKSLAEIDPEKTKRI